MAELKDTGLLEGLPPAVVELPWVKVIDKVYRTMQLKTLGYADKLSVYTDISNVSEEVLDVLAVQFKVDWYDQSYPLKTKRRIIQTALEVRRFYGTDWATETALQSIYPGSKIVEWYDYNGTPGHFKVECDISETQEQPKWQEIRRIVDIYKRMTAHLDHVTFKVTAEADVKEYAAATAAGTMARVTVMLPGEIKPRTVNAEAYAGVCVSGSMEQVEVMLEGGNT